VIPSGVGTLITISREKKANEKKKSTLGKRERRTDASPKKRDSVHSISSEKGGEQIRNIRDSSKKSKFRKLTQRPPARG